MKLRYARLQPVGGCGVSELLNSKRVANANLKHPRCKRGRDGVFQARSFHNILHEDDLREFADICDTPQSGVGQGRYIQDGGNILPFGVQQVSGSQFYSLLPNPNNGNFIVKQLVADDKPVNAEVWNAIGAKVWSGKLVFSGKQANIRLGGIASGGYLLKLYDSKGQHYTIKFIIIE